MNKIEILLVILAALGIISSFTTFGNDEKENNINTRLGGFCRNSISKKNSNNEILPVSFIGVEYKGFYYENPREMEHYF